MALPPSQQSSQWQIILDKKALYTDSEKLHTHSLHFFVNMIVYLTGMSKGMETLASFIKQRIIDIAIYQHTKYKLHFLLYCFKIKIDINLET